MTRDTTQENGRTPFMLNKADIESAIMQFICACHPDIAQGHVIDEFDFNVPEINCIAIAKKT